jgi:hypothetical protein
MSSRPEKKMRKRKMTYQHTYITGTGFVFTPLGSGLQDVSGAKHTNGNKKITDHNKGSHKALIYKNY